jgi:hypothetical protein
MVVPLQNFLKNRTVSATCGCLVVMVCIAHQIPQSQACWTCLVLRQLVASSSIASVADCVARARVDNDSVEMDTTLVHVDSDGMVTSVCLGPDGTTNSISQIFSSYTDCHPVLFKNHFCLSMGDDSMDCMAASSVHGLGFSPAYTERAVSYASAPCEEYGDGAPVQRYAKLPPVAWAC